MKILNSIIFILTSLKASDSFTCKYGSKKYRLQTPCKCGNVKSFNLIKRQIVQTWCFISRRNFSKFHQLFCFFVLCTPYDQKYPCEPLVSVISNVNLAVKFDNPVILVLVG